MSFLYLNALIEDEQRMRNYEGNDYQGKEMKKDKSKSKIKTREVVATRKAKPKTKAEKTEKIPLVWK